MSLKVNLRHLEEEGIRLKGELPVAELDLGIEDELIHTSHPLTHDFFIEQLHDSVLATGSMTLPLDCECGRCLKKFKTKLKLANWALHLPLEGDDKVSIDNDCIDLTPFVREDILLNFPQHPLCKTDCAGLKKKNQVSPVESREAEAKPAIWSELDKLKLK